jgi:hypothetical protein
MLHDHALKGKTVHFFSPIQRARRPDGPIDAGIKIIL